MISEHVNLNTSYKTDPTVVAESKLKILLVDDNFDGCQALGVSLKNLNCEVVSTSSIAESLKILENQSFDLILVNYQIGHDSGLDLIREIKIRKPYILIILMTAYASTDHIGEYIQAGAFDCLAKPFTIVELSKALKKVRETKQSLDSLNKDYSAKKEQFRKKFFDGFNSSSLKKVKFLILKMAFVEASVLISGEFGTGKNEAARFIHEFSSRKSQPFITIHCATLTDSLFESELFKQMEMLGTLFLEDITDLSLTAQSKLLLFLKENDKISGSSPRVICSATKNIKAMVTRGKFRNDLYYRLNVLELRLPPLREYKEDLPFLIQKLYKHICSMHKGFTATSELPTSVMSRFCNYSWPGNIKELQNTLERLVVLSSEETMNFNDVFELVLLPNESQLTATSILNLKELERDQIKKVISKEKNLEKAAQALGIATVTLWRKRKEYGI